jgi:transcriptional regulator
LRNDGHGRTLPPRIVSKARRVKRGRPCCALRSAGELGAEPVYAPPFSVENDTSQLHEFMRRNSFGLLTTQANGRLVASHLPLLLEPDASPQGHLIGHMARANPQWRQVDGEVLVVFSGPHAYISPAWYEAEGTVPTWNYVAVHAYGTLQIIQERGALLEILRKSVQIYEGARAKPWSFDESGPHIEALLKAIVGFRIEIKSLEGKWKLSQNQPEERRRRVIRALSEQADDDARAIAALMTDRLHGLSIKGVFNDDPEQREDTTGPD